MVLQYLCHVSLDLNISVMSDWCYTMLGSQDLNISVLSDEEYQWYYHARFIGSQYLCHGELGPSDATMLGS